MIEAPNGEPTKGLRLSVDQWPVQPPRYASLLPKAALAFAFKQRVPELTISYEDAADVILSNLDRDGRFSRKRVGVALPAKMPNFKANVPRDYAPPYEVIRKCQLLASDLLSAAALRADGRTSE